MSAPTLNLWPDWLPRTDDEVLELCAVETDAIELLAEELADIRVALAGYATTHERDGHAWRVCHGAVIRADAPRPHSISERGRWGDPERLDLALDSAKDPAAHDLRRIKRPRTQLWLATWAPVLTWGDAWEVWQGVWGSLVYVRRGGELVAVIAAALRRSQYRYVDYRGRPVAKEDR